MVVREANGNVTLVQQNPDNYIDLIQNCSSSADGKCEYGLLNDYTVMEMISAYGPLIYAGLFAASLSSALACLVSAAKVFQALCQDKLFPFIELFGKGYGKNNEPRRAYVLAFILAFACCTIGDLNIIAPFITNFFLAAHSLINFACFHASFAKSPGFRPSFKYYNMYVSLLNACLCLTIMFTSSWITALITFILTLALYLFILYCHPGINN